MPDSRAEHTSKEKQGTSHRAGVLSHPGLIAVAVVTLVAAGFLTWPWLQSIVSSGDPSDVGVAKGTSDAESSGEIGATEIVLSPEKLSAAAIQTEILQRQSLTHAHLVPGRLSYNDNRHIEVKASTGGIVTELLVQPGDQVDDGQILAWLNSPEIGTARADVLQRQAEADLAVALAERARNLEQNVVAVIQALRQPLPFDEISRQFTGRTLGNYRKELLAAYSEMQYAETLVRGSTDLESSGAIPGKVIRERQAEAQSARAALESACERAGLDVWQERAHAEAAAKDTMRRVEVARQHLASLLLHDAALNNSGDMPDEGAMGDSDDDLTQLSRVAVRAPFAGTIEARKFSASERVDASDCLFVLADTSTMWVTADIRENDWAAMQLQPGQELNVTIPAMADEVRTATLQYIGREVSARTNSVPVVALLDNADGQLRPGLFVRAAVPVNVQDDVLSAPLASLVQHDAQSFVFVALEEDRFRRTNVVTGDHSNDRIEIVSGLSVGDRVVTHGAFILKSELLLEGEEE